MGNKDLLIAANTIWVVIAAILVMFMQAGFAFLEAGLTRMKNAAHIAGKNVLIFAVCSIVYWAVGFGIAFGDGNAIVGTSGFFPSSNELLAIGQAPYSFFTGIPAASGYLFEVVFAGVSLAIVWGAMAERAKLWVYPAFGVVFTLIYSVTSHWIWHASGWLFGKGMQDFAGSTVVHYQGALARRVDDAERRPRCVGRDHCCLGVRGAVGCDRDRRCVGLDRRRRRLVRRADRHRRSHRRRRRARDVRCVGDTRHRLVRGARTGVESRHRHGRARLHGLFPPARRPGAGPRRSRWLHFHRLV